MILEAIMLTIYIILELVLDFQRKYFDERVNNQKTTVKICFIPISLFYNFKEGRKEDE